jgi:hypothetical protein
MQVSECLNSFLSHKNVDSNDYQHSLLNSGTLYCVTFPYMDHETLCWYFKDAQLSINGHSVHLSHSPLYSIQKEADPSEILANKDSSTNVDLELKSPFSKAQNTHNIGLPKTSPTGDVTVRFKTFE